MVLDPSETSGYRIYTQRVVRGELLR